MNHANVTRPADVCEPMIDAKQAAAALRLPYYWFADHNMRARYRIPHYLLGGLVRYRLSELAAWVATAAVRRREADAGADVPGEGAA
ncbi:hypothetical protein LMG18090_01275 [Ralstonia mannitolilytica]|uniref:DNA-binding protein n=1 Tax=Ralstonia mannitolilytica TaxID=105219 RepID=UPI0028F68EC2|nr:DNA-binding protein [Ralstonia mannitolilytica]CAJ0781093.1 hypothetical protein LMG18090_01275 [Ralstonia mannitolilytica]